jgi:hypothetical protein
MLCTQCVFFLFRACLKSHVLQRRGGNRVKRSPATPEHPRPSRDGLSRMTDAFTADQLKADLRIRFIPQNRGE